MGCTVTYLQHSGFSLRARTRQWLFDYIGGGFRKDPDLPTVALASHAHRDHFSPEIARLADECVLGEGIDPLPGAYMMKPGDVLALEGAQIRAFGSTDCGVSFLVQSDGLSVFHAGDLNFWHWRWESSPAEVRAALEAFEAVLGDLEGIPVDLAFFPVDDRMGQGHDEGADMYLRRIRPRVMIPMHWWGKPEVARAWADKYANDATRVIALTEPGESIDLF